MVTFVGLKGFDKFPKCLIRNNTIRVNFFIDFFRKVNNLFLDSCEGVRFPLKASVFVMRVFPFN